jgi:hypothetical protein
LAEQGILPREQGVLSNVIEIIAGQDFRHKEPSHARGRSFDPDTAHHQGGNAYKIAANYLAFGDSADVGE